MYIQISFCALFHSLKYKTFGLKKKKKQIKKKKKTHGMILKEAVGEQDTDEFFKMLVTDILSFMSSPVCST